MTKLGSRSSRRRLRNRGRSNRARRRYEDVINRRETSQGREPVFPPKRYLDPPTTGWTPVSKRRRKAERAEDVIHRNQHRSS